MTVWLGRGGMGRSRRLGRRCWICDVFMWSLGLDLDLDLDLESKRKIN